MSRSCSPGAGVQPEDVRKLAISEGAKQYFPGLKPGEYINLKIEGRDEVWEVVGIFKFIDREGVLALKGQVRARVTLHACGQALDPRVPWVFEDWEPSRLPPDLRGGGGTRFTPVFEWLERERLRPDLLVYFTDGEGEFPERAPDYPVVWLVKGRAPVPWGERVQLN